MSTDVRPPGPDLRTLPPPDAPASSWDEWSAAMPHDCEEVDQQPDTSTAREGRRRLAGIDAARGTALLGMVAVHVVDPVAPDGTVSLAWRVSSGSSSALFALLAGVGIAFMTGRTRVPSRRDRWVHSRRLAVRGLVILVLGLLLGVVVPPTAAGVILPYLGLLFVLALPVLRLRTRTLLVLAALWAVGGPVVSHLLRRGAAEPPSVNLTPGDLVAAPLPALEYLMLTGLYPVLTWVPYLLVGLALGRTDLSARRHVPALAAVGASLWLGSTTLSWLVLRGGGLDRLAADEAGRLTLDGLTGRLVWGGTGTAPSTSWWWFASAAPHTGLPLDLARTTGVAMLTMALCMALAAVAGWLVRPLAVPGSMTLTLYTAHLLLLGPLGDLPDALGYGAHVLLLGVFALLWHRYFRRGPLEAMVWWLASLAGAPPGRHVAGRG